MAYAVLLVEDSKRDAEAMEVLLRSLGVGNPIVSVDSGEKALAYFKGEGEFADRKKFPIPKIVFLDLRMPGMDGFDVLEWLKQQSHFKDVFVVVLSAYDGLRQIAHAYELGAKSFLVKPCSQADIKKLMDSLRRAMVAWVGSSDS
jgi:CheY-like chemotaxis protein